jgi:hypothetical protein
VPLIVVAIMKMQLIVGLAGGGREAKSTSALNALAFTSDTLGDVSLTRKLDRNERGCSSSKNMP